MVGVWGCATDPDSLAAASRLLQMGVSFVNTDLPRTFDEVGDDPVPEGGTDIDGGAGGGACTANEV